MAELNLGQVVGPRGLQGIQGIKGDKGDQGIQGVIGPKVDVAAVLGTSEVYAVSQKLLTDEVSKMVTSIGVIKSQSDASIVTVNGVDTRITDNKLELQNSINALLAYTSSLENKLYSLTPFTPYHLYRNDNVGVWFDPSDLSTMYQLDPVSISTGVEQKPTITNGDPVGFIMDKSLGYGDNLVTSSGNWKNIDGSYTTGNILEITQESSSGNARYSAPLKLLDGIYYEVEYEVIAPTTLNNLYFCLGTSGARYPMLNATTAGRFKLVLATFGTGGFFEIRKGSSQASVKIEILSIREVKGNHASQAVSAARPLYRSGDSRGLVNLIKGSETFNQSSCSNSKVIAAPSILSPTGTNNVTHLSADTNAMRPTYSAGSANIGTYSVYAKAAEWGKVFLGSTNSGGYWSLVCFDLINGTAGAVIQVSTGAIVRNPVITAVGNGWYRCSVEAVTAYGFIVIPTADGVSPVHTAMTNAGGEGVYIWGRQAEYSTTVTPYQANGVNFLEGIATGKATDRHWLDFDGVDDKLELKNIITPKVIHILAYNTGNSSTAGIIGGGAIEHANGYLALYNGFVRYRTNSTDSHTIESSNIVNLTIFNDESRNTHVWNNGKKSIDILNKTRMNIRYISSNSLYKGKIYNLILSESDIMSSRLNTEKYLASKVGVTL